MILFGFTETANFERRALKLLGDEGISELHWYLCRYPDDGALIPASGGIRKMRWAASGRGKRGGARVIYYYAVSAERMLLLDIYAKNEKENLAAVELERLRTATANWLSGLENE
jgi:hypothetical protein